MIKVMLVAGKGTEDLAKFLEQRGTFTVDFKFTELNGNSEQLLNSIIKIDKFIYVYQVDQTTGKADTNIRLDMQMLQSLITGNKFFKSSEFIFIAGESQVDSQAKRYFSSVMTGSGITSYSIQTLDSQRSFNSIYNGLIGVTETKDFANKYRNLYRRSKDDDAIMAYTPTDDRTSIIEPFNYDKLKSWDDRVKQADSLESAEPINDSDDTAHAFLTNPNFGTINVKGIVESGDFIIVSGDRKSGKATWASHLASSAIQNGKRTLIIDCTKSKQCANIISNNSIALQMVTTIEILQEKKYTGNKMCQFELIESFPAFFRYLQNKRFTIYETIIFIVDLSYLAIVLNNSSALTTHVFCITYPFQKDVSELAVLLSGCGAKVLIPLSYIFADSDRFPDALQAKEIKELIPQAKIINSYEFKNFKDDWLYKKVIQEA